MPKFSTTGEAAAKLGLSRDKLMFALRISGAPEPEAGRLGGRRMFSDADIERLREWFAKRGRGIVAV